MPAKEALRRDARQPETLMRGVLESPGKLDTPHVCRDNHQLRWMGCDSILLRELVHTRPQGNIQRKIPIPRKSETMVVGSDDHRVDSRSAFWNPYS